MCAQILTDFIDSHELLDVAHFLKQSRMSPENNKNEEKNNLTQNFNI